jgi:hypothetical protein
MRLTSFFFAAPLLFVTTLAAAQTPTTPPDAPAPDETVAPAPPPPVVARPAPPPVEAGANEKEVDEDRSVYISISPLHLFLPVVELTGEVRLHRHIGVSVIGGYGTIKADGIAERFKVWEVGGQFVGYPVGHFDHGMQLGLEVLYAGVSTNDNAKGVTTGTATGLATGPFIGYKLATRVGFSFNVQGGVQYVFAQAEASSSNGRTASAEQKSVIPLVNANVGWSF